MRLVLLCCSLLLASVAAHGEPQSFQVYRHRVAEIVAQMMRNYAITYVYGGKQVNSATDCTDCVRCLAELASKAAVDNVRLLARSPQSDMRSEANLASGKERVEKRKIEHCVACAKCSLDCSNFIHQVFNQAGLSMPYLTTKQMLQLSPQSLQKTSHLVTMPQQLRLIRPLDLLVYKGHVVMVEAVSSKGRGTVVHVTAGRELRGPGVALQRERQVEFAHFRGPLRRILRHRHLIGRG